MPKRRMNDGTKVLVVNSGSSSLKYEVYDMPSEESLGKGIVERIGMKSSFLKQTGWNGTFEAERPIEDHNAAIALMSDALTDEQNGILESRDEIQGVGHRVVHGGEKYAESVVIDDEVIKAIDENIELAPLHNPANLTGIIEAREMFPRSTQVAVF
jgi:acetate kinase